MSHPFQAASFLISLLEMTESTCLTGVGLSTVRAGICEHTLVDDITFAVCAEPRGLRRSLVGAESLIAEKASAAQLAVRHQSVTEVDRLPLLLELQDRVVELVPYTCRCVRRGRPSCLSKYCRVELDELVPQVLVLEQLDIRKIRGLPQLEEGL